MRTACSFSLSRALVASSNTTIGASFEKSPREGEPLTLAAGQLVPALADHRVVPLGQRRDEIVDVGMYRGGGDLGLRRHRASIAKVVSDRVVQQVRVLGHERDTGPQRVERELAYVGSVQRDAAACRIVEPRDEARDRGLT